MDPTSTGGPPNRSPPDAYGLVCLARLARALVLDDMAQNADERRQLRRAQLSFYLVCRSVGLEPTARLLLRFHAVSFDSVSGDTNYGKHDCR